MSAGELWRIKLHARLHDPAEKALVLLRDPAGHEGGTSLALRRLMAGVDVAVSDMAGEDKTRELHAIAFSKAIDADSYRIVQRADWWAAAADRPQWPMEEISREGADGTPRTFKVADFAQVNWTTQPQLIHPLTGRIFDLKSAAGGLADTDFHDIRQRSLNHFKTLLVRDGGTDGAIDYRRSLLGFWRFGPELRETADDNRLGELWRVLPADTRVPDHSIWDHLDLTSAFAGAFAADPAEEVALLALSIGPVQPFIEAARSTSDLWAGSHLLSRLAWEAMKPVCEELGPDAILFPRLRGVPQVDLWLRDECGLDPKLFKDCEWNRGSTDANPLFSAALPNRFVALVPASRAAALAQKIEQRLRDWLQGLGIRTVDRLLETAGLASGEEQHCHRQMREQLKGFPEVHWAAVPFSLIRCRDEKRQRDLDVSQLSAAMRPFLGGDGEPGFLSTPAWQLLQKDIRCEDGTTFFAPNPGVLYPAVHDLAERLLAAAKAARRFPQMQQEGWRCSLTGESEWLTTDPAQLMKPPGRRGETLWSALTGRFGIKTGEHLGALPAIKRLWPTLFAEEAGRATGQAISRFVTSTHTMALAGGLAEWLEKGETPSAELAAKIKKHGRVALPRKLARQARDSERGELAAYLPGWLEAARDSDREGAVEEARAELRRVLGKSAVGAYYGLLLMDGDRMGAWLAGNEGYAISYRESFHGQVQQGIRPFAERNPAVAAYLEQKRALSPNRHLAISGALNDFSLLVARHVIEEEHMGRLIYAGGDDVLAMLPVAKLLPAMQRLRQAYSGHDPEDHGKENRRSRLRLQDGFALLDGRLMRMMGTRATASIGAVIAHHQAPLTTVLRELRGTEQRAKEEGGRNAFSLTVLKRSGGALYLTDQWAPRGTVEESGVQPMTALRGLVDALQDKEASRRAAYITSLWTADLPEPGQFGSSEDYRRMLQQLLHHQFHRQSLEQKDQPIHSRRLAQLVHADSGSKDAQYLDNFLAVAEFLAREEQS